MDCVRDNRSRPGFEYRYRFETTTDRDVLLSGGDEDSRFEFEFRTNFTLKSLEEDAEKVLGSQSLKAYVGGGNCDEDFLLLLRTQAGLRLQEYWMPDDQVQKLFRDALNLARSMVGPPTREIPIIVWVDVCTVQLEGEGLDKAMERAIREETLMPYQVYDVSCMNNDEDLMEYLVFELPRTRVEDEEQGLGLMELCPICRRGPTIGDLITLSPTSCGHAFHSRCILQWMMLSNKTNACPLSCRDDKMETSENAQ